jgi:small subunit ribosomal protein S15
MHKNDIIKSFQKHPGDTGSPAVQIALLTARINRINEHLKGGHDYHSHRGLMMMVGLRKRLIKYLKRTESDLCAQVLERLSIRG